MKRVLIILLLITCIAAPLFSGGSREQAAPTEQPAALIIWVDEQRAPIMEALGRKFTSEYQVTVQVQQIGFEDIRDNIKVAGPAGEGADILIGAHDWLGELVISGIIAPIELGAKAIEFSESSISAFMYDGDLYGIPYAVENIAFFYNTDLVPEVPKSWEEVRTVSRNLMESGASRYGFIRQEGDPYHFFPVQSAFGGYIFDVHHDGSYNPEEIGIDDPGSIASAQWLEQMINENLIPGGLDWDTYHSLFETGDAAMIITGPWALDRLNNSGVPFEIAPIPGNGSPFLGVQGFMISAFSKQQSLASAFLTEFVATADVMYELYAQGGRPPAYLEAFAKVENAQLASFGDAGIEGMPMPAIPEMSAVWSAWEDAIRLVMQKQLSGEEAFANAARQVRTILESN